MTDYTRQSQRLNLWPYTRLYRHINIHTYIAQLKQLSLTRFTIFSRVNVSLIRYHQTQHKHIAQRATPTLNIAMRKYAKLIRDHTPQNSCLLCASAARFRLKRTETTGAFLFCLPFVISCARSFVETSRARSFATFVAGHSAKSSVCGKSIGKCKCRGTRDLDETPLRGTNACFGNNVAVFTRSMFVHTTCVCVY